MSKFTNANDEVIGFDFGYHGTKIRYKNKMVTFPSAIAFYNDTGLQISSSDKIYDFEGDRYLVGSGAASSQSFTTTEFKFLYKFMPLLVYYVLEKFEEVNKDKPIKIKSGLSIMDYSQENIVKLKERLANFEVNGRKMSVEIDFTLQAFGIYKDFLKNHKEEVKIDDLKSKMTTIIDIGSNSINVLNINNGAPIKEHSKGYPGSGTYSLINPLRHYLENKYGLPFNVQEATEILRDGSFMFNGVNQEDVAEYVKDAKEKFVKKLFQSILVENKKIFSMSRYVILSGGGAHLLRGSKFPPNVVYTVTDPIFSNVNGYYIS